MRRDVPPASVRTHHEVATETAQSLFPLTNPIDIHRYPMGNSSKCEQVREKMAYGVDECWIDLLPRPGTARKI